MTSIEREPQIQRKATMSFEDQNMNMDHNRCEGHLKNTSTEGLGDSVIHGSQEEQRPILVGYAFGPKKMRSMSVVMAEASMAVSRVVTHFPSQSKHQKVSASDEKRKFSQLSTQDEISLMDECRSSDESQHDTQDVETMLDIDDSTYSSSSLLPHSTTPICIFPSSFSLLSANSNNDASYNQTKKWKQGFDDNSSLVTTTTMSTSTYATNSSSNFSHELPQHLQLVRVCFVPLNLDSPLDEQHGGQKFDAILHKMTEDILCKSQLQQDEKSVDEALNYSDREALKRIQRLQEYKEKHPACCVVDHPNCVQKLMSRSEISRVLKDCLRDVTTKSGIPVRTPRSTTISESDSFWSSTEKFSKYIASHQLEYPLIVKPLTAAGTKQSHRMGVLLGRHGLQNIPHNGSHLLQEYTNHDGVLFKVYVLGKKVWVFKRTSLPNLPLGEVEPDSTCSSQVSDTCSKGFLEFDSQKPYPTLDDFGIHEKESKGTGDHIQELTAAEIRPVADSIRKAFQLELFGFDILVAHKNNALPQKEMLVVDVNYFPSYKEVTNFSELLAQYLAQCGIEGRLRSLDR